MSELFDDLKAQAGLSNSDIAALLNVTPSMIYRYKSGKAAPRSNARLELATKLVRVGVEKSWLPAADPKQRRIILKEAWRRVSPKDHELHWRG